MLSCPHCKRDVHEAALTERVAQMYSSHVFDADYDPDQDDSPIVCVGSWTEGPNRPPKSKATYGAPWQTLGYIDETVSWTPQSAYDAMAKWTLTGTYTIQLKTSTGADGQKIYSSWVKANPSYGDYAYSSWMGIKPNAPWVTYDEPWDALGPIIGGKKDESCPKHDTVIEFGPKNWINTEPQKCWPESFTNLWQPWHSSIPSVYHNCWKEPVQLPSFPEPDWKALAEEVNPKYTYTKLLGAAC